MAGNIPTDPGSIPEFIATILRSVFTTLAGVLVTKGVLTTDQTAGFIGAALFVVTLGWSIYQKINARKRLAAAIAAPAGKAQ